MSLRNLNNPDLEIIRRYARDPLSLDDDTRNQCAARIESDPIAASILEEEDKRAWQQLFCEKAERSIVENPPPSPSKMWPFKVSLIVATAIVIGVASGWMADRRALADEVTRLSELVNRMVFQYRELKKGLGLDRPVRFVGDGSGNAERRPVFVDGTALRCKGWVSNIRDLQVSTIREMRVEYSLYQPNSAGETAPEWSETVPLLFEAEAETTPFDIEIPVPADRQTRKVTIRFIASDEAADLEELSPERLTFTTYVKCLETGPIAYVDPKGGKPVPGHLNTIAVDKLYIPSGAFGAVGDVSWQFVENGAIRFIYQSEGRSPDWGEFRYNSEGKERTDPCPYAGCAWLSPANNWGTEDGGFDLRSFRPRRIVWEARAVSKPVQVSFFVGSQGKVWQHRDDGVPEWTAPQYPETLQQLKLGDSGRTELTTEFQTFSEDLSSISDDQLARVVCGFGWVISGRLDGERQEFEVRNIRYEK